jgi:hypothetical protein
LDRTDIRIKEHNVDPTGGIQSSGRRSNREMWHRIGGSDEQIRGKRGKDVDETRDAATAQLWVMNSSMKVVDTARQ